MTLSGEDPRLSDSRQRGGGEGVVSVTEHRVVAGRLDQTDPSSAEHTQDRVPAPCWRATQRPAAGASVLVMSVGNQKFGIPRKYQYQFGIWYFRQKFLGIFMVFYRYFEKALVKLSLNIGIFGRTKIGLVFGFCSCHFIGIGLVSV